MTDAVGDSLGGLMDRVKLNSRRVQAKFSRQRDSAIIDRKISVIGVRGRQEAVGEREMSSWDVHEAGPLLSILEKNLDNILTVMSK